MPENVRAATTKDAKIYKNDPHRWFHLRCWQKDNKGFKYIIDSHDKARSDDTLCLGCMLPINVAVSP